MRTILAVLAAGLLICQSQAAAQTRAQVEAEPIVKLQPGETFVPGQCLTQQELDLIDGLNALRRPTVGVEAGGEESSDDPPPFDPNYFVGRWQVQGVLPESPLGASGEFIGTEVVRHVEGCTYESTLEATRADEEITIRSRLVYDRREHYLVRIEDDSRGFELIKVGPLRGDPGGFFSHHWIAPSVTFGGNAVRLSGRTFMTSPYAFQLRMQMSTDDGPPTNFGTLTWERVD